MNQTGVASTASPRQARRKRLSAAGTAGRGVESGTDPCSRAPGRCARGVSPDIPGVAFDGPTGTISTGMGLSLLPLVMALSAGAPLTYSTPTKVEFERGVTLFEDFKDSEAGAIFRRVLERSPPGFMAAKAHLYLGLIAFNALDPDEAKLEFRRALEANPAAELPSQASPKARLAFGEVRRDMAKELAPP